MALLAPGLVVYANYVRAPHDALVLEVLGQQWQWRFRFPGADGKLGASDARFVSAANPFGLDPGRPGRPGRPPGRRPTRCTCRWASRCWC